MEIALPLRPAPELPRRHDLVVAVRQASTRTADASNGIRRFGAFPRGSKRVRSWYSMPWKVVSILWPAIVAALLPVDLPNVISRLPHIITRLAALTGENRQATAHDRSRPHQADDFRSRFVASTGSLA
jgi:hypothetical protein